MYQTCISLKFTLSIRTHTHTHTYIYINIYSAFNKFPDFFVMAFKIVTMLLLYI